MVVLIAARCSKTVFCARQSRKLAGRYLAAFAVRIEFLNRDDALRVAIWQTAQQHAIDDTEDRSARADTEREGYHHDGREPRMLQQPPHAITNVFDVLNPFLLIHLQISARLLF